LADGKLAEAIGVEVDGRLAVSKALVVGVAIWPALRTLTF
jgi:hypothetical protein